MPDSTPARASPTAAELAAAGVEVNANPEPPRASFKEAPLDGEPPSDRKLTLASGLILRERLQRVPLRTTEANGSPVEDGAFNIVITHALLTESGQVATAPDGSFRIKTGAYRHEVSFDAERMGAMTDEQVTGALLQQREVAARRAELFFAGIEKGDRLLGGRLVSPPTTQAK